MGPVKLTFSLDRYQKSRHGDPDEDPRFDAFSGRMIN